MASRNFLPVAVAIVALAVGACIFAHNAHSSVTSGITVNKLSAAATSRQASRPPALEESQTSVLASVSKALGIKQEIIVFGSVGVFAVLMLAVIVGGATSNSKSRTEAQLQLLIEEKEKAENLARLKSEFLNQVSHELRTPLAVIIGYIECMTDGLYGTIESKHQEILQVVAKQSAHLKNMIDQILIYSRLEAGKQPVRVEDIQLTKAINDMKDTFEFLCRQKGLDLCWELARDPMQIRSDSTRLKEVISNLLQNAVKYTDHGSVSVRAGKLPAKDLLFIEVSDTGMGISEQHLPNIFEPFMQAHKTSSTNSRGGIGLGLSIVKKHLEQIRATISVESKLGQGSTFRIVLPRNCDNQVTRTSWLSKLRKLLPFAGETKALNEAPIPGTAGNKNVDTRHAMG
jgi:signal transduction histidine kinase